MSENVGASTSRNPKGLHGLYTDNFIFTLPPNKNLIYVNMDMGFYNRSRGSVVGIATGYELDDRGVGIRASVGARIFSSPRRQDRLCGPPNLLSKEYRE
jgi:hypothetical protein